jgi:streptogramin lyase
VWVGWRDQPSANAKIRRIDGVTGEIDDEVEVPDWEDNWGHGPYGGAIDANGDFWAMGTLGTLLRVDGETMETERIENDGHITYGIALDQQGNPWLASWSGHLVQYDVDAGVFVDHGAFTSGRLRGLAIDGLGNAWVAANDECGLLRYDIENGETVADPIALPGCVTPVGVSVDVDGFVWVVDKDASRAYKVDPDTYDIVTVEGLISPYTYSDMTGAGFDIVINPVG